jgi:homoserine dehydrogenase
VSVRIALFGTGNVGRALLARIEALQRTPRGAGLALAYAANTRRQEGDVTAANVVVDATASDDIAARHAAWLARGLHVVTANKLGQGTSLARWRAIADAARDSGAHYGDAATVGAGLPLLRSLRALRDGGDGIQSIAGVLSGSLAWLLGRYDGTTPFSALVREARAAGFTEPDPRADLSGEDVRRKLLILARSAGVSLEHEAVNVAAIASPALDAARTAADIDEALPTLDAGLSLRFALAAAQGRRLHLVARWDPVGGARVGIEALSPDDPLAGGQGTDNRVAIQSARYAERPLVIQGPGAGAGITAAALLDDVLSIGDALARQVPALTGSAGRAAKNDSIDCGRLIA